MKNSFIMASLTTIRLVDVVIFTETPIPNNSHFIIYIDNKKYGAAKVVKKRAVSTVYYYQLELDHDYDFSKNYYIYLNNFSATQINVTNAVDFPEFDNLFNYDGDDLGSFYTPEETNFAVWAPLATNVFLRVIDTNNNETYHTMIRTDKGVYRLAIKGDLKNNKYHYLVENNGIRRECNDLYAKGTSLQSEFSVVVDLEEIKKLGKIKPTNNYQKPVDAVIYETSVRDFTEGNNTNIVNRGKYLGLVEENRKTSAGHPAGLDYLKYLGITHLQLLPVIDFYTVIDDKPEKKYNWGYDPISFFNLEGSYSLHPEDGLERLKEFKIMVNKLHEANIRVVLDVVYNHLYEHRDTAFEATVPNYYFRNKRNGEISQVSGCGNDFASERYMARKMIVDSVNYFVDLFDVDGYRFDLMGLLDIKTINQVDETLRAKKPDIILYGEGWNMINEMNAREKAMSENADLMPNIGFFNDSYRDIVKGPTFLDRIYEKGFAGGDLNYRYGFDYAFHGSVLDHTYHHRYLSANQSINFIECHDNGTLFDKFSASNSGENEEELLKRVQLANAMLLLSYGVPFIHMGQEIGLSKNGLDNTYNILKINQMDWKLVDERFDMVDRISHLIKLRKNKLNYLHLSDPRDINNKFNMWLHQDSCYILNAKDVMFNNRPAEVIIIFNPTLNNCVFSIGDYFILENATNENGFHVNNVLIPRLMYLVLYKYKD